MTQTVSVEKDPARLSAAVAVGAAALAVGLVATETSSRVAVVAVCGCLGLFALGRQLRGGNHYRPGTALLLFSAVALLGTILLGPVLAADIGVSVGTGIGLLGVALVGVSLLPVLGGGSRALLRVGAGVTLLSVIVCSVMLTAPRYSLLLAGAAAIVSFDVGEHAIGVGEQLGRRARTRPIELTHALASAAVGVLGVTASLLVMEIGRPGLPLSAFALLLVVVVLLGLALHD